MKMTAIRNLLLFSFLALLFAGCATKTDWNARIGHYTYDQAVMELGPPDKSARLTDGKLVTEWVTRYNSGGTVFVTSGYYPGQVGVAHSVGPTTYTDTLRLTFDTHNVLYAWQKN